MRIFDPHRRLIAVPVIIGLNALVFLAWQAARTMPGLAELMVTNFLVSAVHLAHGLVWTVVTSAFSHNALWHLALNMIVLWSFGSVLERLWRVRVFTTFYLVAAVVASLSHCAVSALLLGQPESSALGASGAVSGLLLAYAFMFPRHRILVFGVIPVPALAGALAFVGLDLWGLFAQTRGGGLPIGHGAHLGGALTGALFYLAWVRKRMPERPSSAPVRVTPEEAAEIDRIRLKLEREGSDALTENERAFILDLRRRTG